MKTLKFDFEPIITMAVADRRNRPSATVRYEDEKGIEKGDRIKCVTSDKEQSIGDAYVIRTETVKARMALHVIRENWAEYDTNSLGKMLNNLNKYYDDDIVATTEVKVIILDPHIQPSKDIEI